MNTVLGAKDVTPPSLNLRVADDFPLIKQHANDLHYLDNAATTQKPQSVITALSQCYEQQLAPVHRGLYPLAEQASNLYEQARRTIGEFISSPNPEQLIFTRSCTESINLVAEGWAATRLRPGDWLWVTKMEHHSNYLPWLRLCEKSGAVLRVLDIDDNGQLLISDNKELFDRRTRLIALTHVSNVLGVENGIAELCQIASLLDIAVLVDGAQAVSHLDVDVEKLGCDFYAFSAHKMYGPAGIGALYAKPERLSQMQPLLVGGGMVDRIDGSQSSWSPPPACFEAGSPNLPGAVGFAAAAEYMQALGLGAIRSHIADVTNYAVNGLNNTPYLEVYAAGAQDKSALVSFQLADVHPHDFAQVAAEFGVALRAGHHCCQPLMKHLNVAATNRVSFAVYSSYENVDVLFESIEYAQKLFR